LTGQLAAVRSHQLAVPRIPSWQTTIRWMEEEGSVVKAGQRVLEFDTTSFAQNHSEKLLARDRAEGELDRALADQAGVIADAEFQVAQKAIAADKARIAAEIPEEFLRGKDYQANQIALERAQTELAKARELLEAKSVSSRETIRQKTIAVEKARRELEAATEAMAGMILTAPRDGILVIADHPWQGRKLQIGDPVWVGLPVASLPDLSVMNVRAKLSDVDDGRIAPELPVVCTLDAYPERTFGGRIVEITPVAQEEVGRSLRRAYNVRIDLDDGDPQTMRPGMSVKIEVRSPAQQSVLLAPREGLDFALATPRARLASGEEVDVTLGACNRDHCVVLGGVEEGARLRAAI
jgi:multidrug resistance efflux pump